MCLDYFSVMLLLQIGANVKSLFSASFPCRCARAKPWVFSNLPKVDFAMLIHFYTMLKWPRGCETTKKWPSVGITSRLTFFSLKCLDYHICNASRMLVFLKYFYRTDHSISPPDFASNLWPLIVWEFQTKVILSSYYFPFWQTYCMLTRGSKKTTLPIYRLYRCRYKAKQKDFKKMRERE